MACGLSYHRFCGELELNKLSPTSRTCGRMTSEEAEILPPPDSEVLNNLVDSTRSVFNLLHLWYESDNT